MIKISLKLLILKKIKLRFRNKTGLRTERRLLTAGPFTAPDLEPGFV